MQQISQFHSLCPCTLHVPMYVIHGHKCSKNVCPCMFIYIQEKNRAWSSPSLLPFFPPPSRFLHQLQTSITRSFIKLECFLRPFLKTRSHDESAHTFKSSLRFLEVPQKGVLKKLFVCIFFTTFFYMFGLIGSVKTFSKVLGVGMNVGPYMAYILYI